MTINEMIAVLQAAKEGRAIEYRSLTVHPPPPWAARLGRAPDFNFANFEYRVRPEPRKAREWWIVLPEKGSIYFALTDEALARQTARAGGKCETVLVREVLSGGGSTS